MLSLEQLALLVAGTMWMSVLSHTCPSESNLIIMMARTGGRLVAIATAHYLKETLLCCGGGVCESHQPDQMWPAKSESNILDDLTDRHTHPRTLNWAWGQLSAVGQWNNSSSPTWQKLCWKSFPERAPYSAFQKCEGFSGGDREGNANFTFLIRVFSAVLRLLNPTTASISILNIWKIGSFFH